MKGYEHKPGYKPHWDDHNWWYELGKSDPDKFESERLACLYWKIEHVLSPDDPVRQDKMKGFIWRKVQDLRHYKDPVARMTKAVSLMYDSFFTLNDELAPFRSKPK